MYLIRWTLTIFFTCLPGLSLGQTWDQGNQNLAIYLEDHDLSRLSTRLLAMEYARTVAEPKREELANELREKYRRLLLSNPLPTDAHEIIERAESLMRDFPGKNFSGLGLALSHANYLLAEKQFLDWWSNGAPGRSRSDVLTSFDKVQSELQRWVSLDELQQENALARLPFDNEQRKTLQLQLQQIQTRLALSNYLMGWTFYFRFIIPDKPDFRKLKQSHQSFYRSLQIEQNKTIDQIDSKWLDFSNATGRRALLGLAMVYTAQSETLAAKFCFEQLSQISAELDESTIHFNSLAFAKNWTQAYQFAKNNTPENHHHGFWNSVINAGFVATQNSSNTATKIEGSRLQRLGLLGLLRAYDANSIDKFVNKTGMQLQDNSVEDLWIQALVAFKKPDSKRSKETLNFAVEKSRQALRIAPQAFDAIDKIRIQFLTALIEFQRQHYEIPLKILPESCDDFLPTDPELAERIQWLRCRCLIQLSGTDNRLVGKTIYSMNQLLSDFPDTRLANRIRFERVVAANRLLAPQHAITELEKIKQGDPFFPESRFEIVKNQFYVWENALADSTAAEKSAFQTLVEADKRYKSVAQRSEQKLNSTWFVLEAAIRRESPENEVRSRIDVANSLAKSSGRFPAIEPQLMHYRFLAAKKFEHQESALRIAQWLVENSGHKKSKVAALAYLADNMELLNLESHQRAVLYEQLSNNLGNSESDIKNSTNARIAASRLVEVWIDNDSPEKAKALNDKLLNANPNSQKYNLFAARIASKQNDAKRALQTWNRIARSSPAGSELWLEAKYELVRILIDSDAKRANALLTQSLSLAGKIAPSWQNKFDELRAIIDKTKRQRP